MGYLTRLSSGPFNLFLPCRLPSATVSLPLSSFRKLLFSRPVTRTMPFALPFLALLTSQGLPLLPTVFPVAQTTLNPQKHEQGDPLVFNFSHVLVLRSFHFHLQLFQSFSHYSNLFFSFQSYLKQNYMKKKKQKVGSGRRVGRYLSRRHHNKFCWCLGEKKKSIPPQYLKPTFPWLGTTYN